MTLTDAETFTEVIRGKLAVEMPCWRVTLDCMKTAGLLLESATLVTPTAGGQLRVIVPVVLSPPLRTVSASEKEKAGFIVSFVSEKESPCCVGLMAVMRASVLDVTGAALMVKVSFVAPGGKETEIGLTVAATLSEDNVTKVEVEDAGQFKVIVPADSCPPQFFGGFRVTERRGFSVKVSLTEVML